MLLSFMTFSTPDKSFAECVALARRIGWDGIELRIGAGHRHGLELDTSRVTRAEARRVAEDSDVAVSCVAASCRFADPADQERWIEECLRALDLAADLGAPSVRVFGGEGPHGAARAESCARVAEALRRTAESAAERGVRVCLETHDDWCDPERVSTVMRLVDHPAVGANWDILHPVRTGFATVEESFRALRPWIAHVHVHDVSDFDQLVWAPIGSGLVDHASAVRCLSEAGYEGWVSGEWIGWTEAEEHLPRELASLRALIGQAMGEGS